MSGVGQNVLWCLLGVFCMLAIASIIIYTLRSRVSTTIYFELGNRIRSWWLMVAMFASALVVSRTITLILIAIISFLALKEYFSFIPTRRADRRVLFWAYIAIPVQYYWIAQEWYGMFIIFIPVYMFIFIPFRMIVVGDTHEFLRAVGTIHWGLMVTVFSISHLAYLLVLPASGNPVAGGVGLILYLVFLTEFNDVAQYVWGKLLGREKITPTVSPGKTVEGFLGGQITTVIFAVLLSPVLTPMDLSMALVAGLIIAIGGFLGDVTISAVKRDIGIKDSGFLLPGHGGVLDRVDSLTYTAPLFFHFIHYCYY